MHATTAYAATPEADEAGARRVANDVYAVARAELATLVSPRAAERMLDAALASADVAPDRVTPRQMRALVAGPIQNDLRSILPQGGLSVVLGALAERLRSMPTAAPAPANAAERAMSPAPPTPVPTAGEEPRIDDTFGRSSLAPGAPLAGTHATPPTDASTTVEAASGSAVAGGHGSGAGIAVAERPADVAPPTEPSAGEPVAMPSARATTAAPLLDADPDDEALQRMALSFARLPHVTGVAILREGKLAFSRGTGVDAEQAALLVPAAAGVMGRHGSWRSYAMTHDRGQLFVVPVGRSHIVLAGRSQFNLGAVLTALETLEEAL